MLRMAKPCLARDKIALAIIKNMEPINICVRDNISPDLLMVVFNGPDLLMVIFNGPDLLTGSRLVTINNISNILD